MSWYNAALLGALFTAGQTPGQTGQPTPTGPVTAAAPIVTPAASTPVEAAPLSFADAERPGGFLVGDTAFPRFISPVSNPVFSKDPRAQTYIRGLFVNDVIPGDHPLGGGSFQAMAAQVNVALSERLTFIADKDGYAWINPQRAPSSSGFLNLGAGLKYFSSAMSRTSSFSRPASCMNSRPANAARSQARETAR